MADNPMNTSADDAHDDNPTLIPAQPGRTVSARGLLERIVTQYQDEYGTEGTSIPDTVERRSRVRDVADYIFGVEAVRLEPRERAQLLMQAYSELFGYGPLDSLLNDDEITTIALEGARKVSVRRGPGAELEQLPPIFESLPQMRRIVERLLWQANAELRDDLPIIEVGLRHEARNMSLSVVAPPLVSELAVDIRLHPTQAPILDDWVEHSILTDEAAQILTAIAQSAHGCVIVGDTEAGKTTLLNMLAALVPEAQHIAAVERAGELNLVAAVQRFVVQWPHGDESGYSFGEQIMRAYDQHPDVLLLDEVRADEPELIAPLLNASDAPRLLWAFRGASEPKRIRSALSMIARLADRSQPEAMVYQLYQRLPFVIVLKRRKDRLELLEIAEWQFSDETDARGSKYADYVSLLQKGWEGLERTGKPPQHPLALSDDFWQ